MLTLTLQTLALTLTLSLKPGQALLAQAGFAPEGVQVRREGRGCAVVRAEKAAEGVV